MRCKAQTGGEVLFFDQTTETSLVDGAVHTVLTDQARDRLLVGSAYGITAIDPFEGSTSKHELPTGMEMNTMIRWTTDSSDYLIIGTNAGIHTITLENGLTLDGYTQ